MCTWVRSSESLNSHNSSSECPITVVLGFSESSKKALLNDMRKIGMKNQSILVKNHGL